MSLCGYSFRIVKPYRTRRARAPASAVSGDARERRSLWRDAPVRWVLAMTAAGFTSPYLMLASLPYWAVENGASAGSAGLVTTCMLVGTVVGPVLRSCCRLPLRVARNAFRLACAAHRAGPGPYLASGRLDWLLALCAVRGAGVRPVDCGDGVDAERLGSSAPSRRDEAVGAHGLAVSVPNLLAVPAGAALAVAGPVRSRGVAGERSLPDAVARSVDRDVP
jgi:hypothetical protein